MGDIILYALHVSMWFGTVTLILQVRKLLRGKERIYSGCVKKEMLSS